MKLIQKAGILKFRFWYSISLSSSFKLLSFFLFESKLFTERKFVNPNIFTLHIPHFAQVQYPLLTYLLQNKHLFSNDNESL